MDEFVIEGRTPLRGTMTPSGNKNAAFPLIAAALLTDQPVTLRNLPDISDVRTMLEAVEGLGVEVERHDRHTVTLHAAALHDDGARCRPAAADPGCARAAGPAARARGRGRGSGRAAAIRSGGAASTPTCSACRRWAAVVEEDPDLVLRAGGCAARTSCSTRRA